MKSSIVAHVQECTSVYFMYMCVSLCMLKEHIVTYHVRGMSYSLHNIFCYAVLRCWLVCNHRGTESELSV